MNYSSISKILTLLQFFVCPYQDLGGPNKNMRKTNKVNIFKNARVINNKKFNYINRYIEDNYKNHNYNLI